MKIIDAADQLPTAMIPPMSKLVRDGKTRAARRAPVINRDDCSISAADDVSLAPLELSKTNLGADIVSDRFKVDFARFGDAKFLEQLLGVRQSHQCPSLSSSDGKMPSSRIS